MPLPVHLTGRFQPTAHKTGGRLRWAGLCKGKLES
jgi:hypothetical protein